MREHQKRYQQIFKTFMISHKFYQKTMKSNKYIKQSIEIQYILNKNYQKRMSRKGIEIIERKNR